METFIIPRRRLFLIAAEIEPWIVNSLMENTCEDIGEMLSYQKDILQREFAFIELALKEDVVDDPVHKRGDAGRSRVYENP